MVTFYISLCKKGDNMKVNVWIERFLFSFIFFILLLIIPQSAFPKDLTESRASDLVYKYLLDNKNELSIIMTFDPIEELDLDFPLCSQFLIRTGSFSKPNKSEAFISCYPFVSSMACQRTPISFLCEYDESDNTWKVNKALPNLGANVSLLDVDLNSDSIDELILRNEWTIMGVITSTYEIISFANNPDTFNLLFNHNNLEILPDYSNFGYFSAYEAEINFIDINNDGTFEIIISSKEFDFFDDEFDYEGNELPYHKRTTSIIRNREEYWLSGDKYIIK